MLAVSAPARCRFKSLPQDRRPKELPSLSGDHLGKHAVISLFQIGPTQFPSTILANIYRIQRFVNFKFLKTSLNKEKVNPYIEK
jgi:hypothetical protein